MPDLITLFSYSFMQRALVVGLLVAPCAALLGISLVLRRYAMIGDGLSHVGFGAISLAFALQAAPLPLALPIVVIAAILLLRLSENNKIEGDSAIALISSSAVAFGVIVTSLSKGMSTDVYDLMFGSILAMTRQDVILSSVLSVSVLLVYILFYRKIFSITFDENFARAIGVRTKFYTMLIALLTAVTIVVGMRIMGSMLISSLIIFPALTAMRFFRTFRWVTISAAFISILCFVIGLVLSFQFSLPTGATIVIVNLIFFLIFSFLGRKR